MNPKGKYRHTSGVVEMAALEIRGHALPQQQRTIQLHNYMLAPDTPPTTGNPHGNEQGAPSVIPCLRLEALEARGPWRLKLLALYDFHACNVRAPHWPPIPIPKCHNKEERSERQHLSAVESACFALTKSLATKPRIFASHKCRVFLSSPSSFFTATRDPIGITNENFAESNGL